MSREEMLKRLIEKAIDQNYQGIKEANPDSPGHIENCLNTIFNIALIVGHDKTFFDHDFLKALFGDQKHQDKINIHYAENCSFCGKKAVVKPNPNEGYSDFHFFEPKCCWESVVIDMALTPPNERLEYLYDKALRGENE